MSDYSIRYLLTFSRLIYYTKDYCDTITKEELKHCINKIHWLIYEINLKPYHPDLFEAKEDLLSILPVVSQYYTAKYNEHI